MRRLLLGLLALTTMASAAEELSMRALMPKDGIDRAVGKALSFRLPRRYTATLVCAIPLKEIRMVRGKRMDPMTKPEIWNDIDHIGDVAPIQACPQNR